MPFSRTFEEIQSRKEQVHIYHITLVFRESLVNEEGTLIHTYSDIFNP